MNDKEMINGGYGGDEVKGESERFAGWRREEKFAIEVWCDVTQQPQ